MSSKAELENNPIVQQIRERLANFDRREPYITNTAIRIYLDFIEPNTPSPQPRKGTE